MRRRGWSRKTRLEVAWIWPSWILKPSTSTAGARRGRLLCLMKFFRRVRRGGGVDDAQICMAVAAGQVNYPGTLQFAPVEKVTSKNDLRLERVDQYSAAKMRLMRAFPWLTTVKWQPGPLPPHSNE